MPSSNQIFVISPYRLHGTWVFDDPRVDLMQEPFVCGVPEIIERFLSQTIGTVDRFRLLFSASPFPGYQIKLDRCEGESCGQWYEARDAGMKGWLCPALFKYFDVAPDVIYAKAEAIGETDSAGANAAGKADITRKPKPDFGGTIRGFLADEADPDNGMIVMEIDEEAKVLASAGGYETAESYVCEDGYLCQHAAMIPSDNSTSRMMTIMATGQSASIVHDAQGKCEIVVHIDD